MIIGSNLNIPVIRNLVLLKSTDGTPKFVVGVLGTLALYAPVITDRMTVAAGCGLRRRYLSSLQQMERRLDVYKDDLNHIARPNFTFSLKSLEAWLQLTLGASLIR